MNIANLNKNNTKMPFKQLSFILTILLLLFTFSFACSPAVNPTDNNDEKTVFTPSSHIKVSDGSSDITESLIIAVDTDNQITITGLSNSVAPNKTYTLTITPLDNIFSTTDGNDIRIEITAPITTPDGFLSGDGVPLPDKFTITNDNDPENPITYTLKVPFSAAPVEDWLTSNTFATYITATFPSQVVSLELNGYTLSVNGLINADGVASDAGAISFELPQGFEAIPSSFSLPNPTGTATVKITLDPNTFTISETDNKDKNSQEYTIGEITFEAITVFTPSQHITITDNSITDPTPNDITTTVNTDNQITITGLSNAVGENKEYTLTINSVEDLFSTGNSPITITIRDPDDFSPGPGVLSQDGVLMPDKFTITNDIDPSTSITYTVEVQFSGAPVQDWLTQTEFRNYFTGATFSEQTLVSTLDNNVLSFNFDENSDRYIIAIDGSSIFNLQNGTLVLTTTNIPDGYTVMQENLSDPDQEGVAALSDAPAGKITIAEEGNTENNTKTYDVTISLAAYESPVEPSHVTAMIYGITADPSNIVISGTDITISGFLNFAGSAGSGTVDITPPTPPTAREYTVIPIDPATPLPLTFTDPEGTDPQNKVAGTVSVTSAGVTALHTIIISFSAPIGLTIISENVQNGSIIISPGADITLIDLDACVLLPPPDFERDGSTVTVRGFPSYFDRRKDEIPTGSDSYTVNRVLILEDATGVLDDNYFVIIKGFPACDDASIFTNTKTGADADNAYEIDSAPKLELLSHLVRSDNANTVSKYYKLTDDIDLGLASLPWSETASGETGEGFPPVGLTDTTFQGTFDCADNSISNLYINKATGDGIGLFGYTSNNAAIQNCSLINVNVTGNNNVGGLAGDFSASRITNSYTTGSVSGTNKVGGLVGGMFSTSSITSSYSTGSVTGNAEDIGGLAGLMSSNSHITNSYATATVMGVNSVGGLAGNVFATSRITNSYATGSVGSEMGVNDIGGLAGRVYGTSTSIENSYATGNVTGNNRVGGLTGSIQSSATVKSSYATGSVTGTRDAVNLGGFVGRLASASITNSYATGNVSGTANVGGFAGRTNSSSSITNSYWDTETSGQMTSAGAAVPKSTTDLKTGSVGVDIFTDWNNPDTVWKFDPDTQYPRLITVVCPNRQYPDPNNVPTTCTAL